jgi:hypothetical protein
MHRHQRALPVLLLLSVICLLPAAPAAAQADVITVGSAVTNSANIDIPVYIRDTSGTPLGVDQPPGSKIQSYSIKVDFSPASAVQTAAFSKAGITAGLTASFTSNPQSPGSTTLVQTFQEATNPIPFTLNGVLPGNQVAHILVHVAPTVTVGQVITMTIDPALTQLANDAGTTNETTAATNLTLVNGTITIGPSFVYDVPAISPWMLALLAMTLALVAVRIRT